MKTWIFVLMVSALCLTACVGKKNETASLGVDDGLAECHDFALEKAIEVYGVDRHDPMNSPAYIRSFMECTKKKGLGDLCPNPAANLPKALENGIKIPYHDPTVQMEERKNAEWVARVMDIILKEDENAVLADVYNIGSKKELTRLCKRAITTKDNAERGYPTSYSAMKNRQKYGETQDLGDCTYALEAVQDSPLF